MQQFRSELQAMYQKILTHKKPLLIVLAASLIGQVLVLIQTPFFYRTPDSISYERVAQHMLEHGNIFDTLRTPGYSALLALVFGVANSEDYTLVVIVQALLMLVMVAEIYVLTLRLSGKHWLACVVSSLIGLNVFIMGWERSIMTEGLSMWAIVTTFLLLERYVRTARLFYLWAMIGVLTYSVMIRPFNLYMPVVILAFLAYRALRTQTLRKNGLHLAAALLVSYGLIVGYMFGNAAQNNYFGLSFVSNINLLGKVMEYHLQDTPVTAPNAALRSDLITYMNDSSTVKEPWRFSATNPAYYGNYYAALGPYSKEVILKHPGTFVAAGLRDSALTLVATPRSYAKLSFVPFYFKAFLGLNAVELASYVLLPLLLLYYAVQFLRAPKRPETLLIAVLLVCMVLDVLLSGMLSYQTTLPTGQTFNEFYRMRAPYDWAMILITVIAANSAVTFLRRKRTERQRAVAEPLERELAPTLPRVRAH